MCASPHLHMSNLCVCVCLPVCSDMNHSERSVLLEGRRHRERQKWWIALSDHFPCSTPGYIEWWKGPHETHREKEHRCMPRLFCRNLWQKCALWIAQNWQILTLNAGDSVELPTMTHFIWRYFSFFMFYSTVEYMWRSRRSGGVSLRHTVIDCNAHALKKKFPHFFFCCWQS